MFSPAKLNLSLRILGKRPDGFHEIDTLMVKLPGLADEITIEPANGFSFTCTDHSLPTDGRNLVVKAAHALSEKSAHPLDFHIHLEKHIPHGAGLGGGSSNAATTLLALNGLLDSPLSAAELHKIAATLGSDIPFFLHPGAARCTGRGEIIEPAESPPPLEIALFKPRFSVPTVDAYRNCLDAEPIPGISYGEQNHEGLTLVNDLEKPVFAKHRYLAEFKSWLQNRRDVEAALMTGSGSAVFAILKRKAKPAGLINSAHRHFDKNLWTWSGTL